MQIRVFQRDDTQAVIALWERCELLRPWNDPARDIERKLAADSGPFLVGEVGGSIVATAMAGYDGHRGWINYLAVEPEMRGRGFGRSLVHSVEDALAALGCPKINVQIRRGNDAVEFYRELGFREDDVVSMGKRLDADGV